MNAAIFDDIVEFINDNNNNKLSFVLAMKRYLKKKEGKAIEDPFEDAYEYFKLAAANMLPITIRTLETLETPPSLIVALPTCETLA